MVETLHIPQDASKEDLYKSLVVQIVALIEHENNLIANLANIAAVLDMTFGHLWTGFYLEDGDNLVLGPFQGPLACTRIPVKPVPRGVCGAAAAEQKTMLVPDVDKFGGHIACSSASRSEIVVPLIDNSGKTRLVLDIDSSELNSFNEIDQLYCEQIIQMIKDRHY